MADLSDLLGHILEEVTRARVSADAEAVRTAKQYAADPDGLLRHFPVPRVRLPNVEITVPMIVTDVPSGYVDRADPGLLSQTVTADVTRMLSSRNITIATADIAAAIKADPALSKGQIDQAAAERLSGQLAGVTKQPASGARTAADTHTQVVSLIRDQIVQTLQALPVSPAGIGIDAATTSIREFNPAAGQGANVVYLKMTISEEALEMELDQPVPSPEGNPGPGPAIKRLLPE